MTSDASVDIQFFEKQKRIYPKRVDGVFRRLKWVLMIITLGIYYFVPFIRFDRGPNAPDQAVLIDLERGRAYWFWFEIWPQEVYILTGILIFAAICLFFVTSLLGRVWCGYLCFQTVWTDLYVWVERLIQGDRNKRKKLREGPWTWEKIRKITLTHIIWLAIGWCTAGSFVLYFNDAPTLVRSFFEFNVSPTVLTFIVCLTFSTYLMAGFAREQVCTFMCPYARFQSAMFDKDTLVIGYDIKRGEKRGKLKKGTTFDGRGHCIDCSLCVQVCPTGIDIRNGLQMECIACGLCVDACDGVMEKLDLPKGLIRYDTERNFEEGIREKRPISHHFIRPRTIFYSVVLLLIGCILFSALLFRPPLVVTALHDRNPLYVTLSSGNIRNGYEIKILNKTHEDRLYTLAVTGLDGAELSVKAAGDVTIETLHVDADSVGHYHVFVQAEKPAVNKHDIVLTLTDNEDGFYDSYKTVFISGR